ncbi:isoprenoid synthase domain-containing protein [Achaetomium macrosporum]|uniref:Isoprenoid synthase domain-containing protein n=1 Tax=Achaetomium macrosporum TaxID=79813 RepID=A0AAN7HBK0_9PEZI|nr:isoprenoid synthase domain-containing protein [Achaetomium macrosporum]
MEFPNSRLVEPSAYPADMDGLSSWMPVRVHRNASLADRGALRAQKDWLRTFGPFPPGFAGTMGPEYNFVATTMPEILPDRLELVAYITEMAFLVDDMIDMAGESPMVVAAPYAADMLRARELLLKGGELDETKCSPITRVFVDFGREMLAMDAESAMQAFRWLEKWAKLMMIRPSAKEPQSLDEYLKDRLVDVTSPAAIGLKLFAMGLRIPETQQQMCLDLSRPFWLQTSLTNDYHSFHREMQEARAHGKSVVNNAIWVLMNKHSMTLDEANSVCREKAKEYAAEYLRVLEGVRARDDLCKDAKFLLETLQFGMSGNIVWGLQCLRYHDDRTLTPAQLEMAKVIWADKTIGWSQARQGQQEIGNGAFKSPSLPQMDHSRIAAEAVDYEDMAVIQDAPALDREALEAPSRYLDSLPAKGIRDKVIDELNFWFQVPPEETSMIKKIISLLHGASLMMDDIQDSSQLRRGQPATHLVFGQMQTINSAGYRFLDALSEVRKLNNVDELRDLYIGQSHDLAWTFTLKCPTEDEYLAMVDNKTAGLFRMLARMLDAKSDSPTKPDVALLTRFMTLLGRLFQIRDDYMNLTSADYTKQKGFCEDLDEGKYSLPLIHALAHAGSSPGAILLKNLLAQRHIRGSMSLDQKRLVLQQLREQGSLEYTRRAVDALQAVLRQLAQQMGMMENEGMRKLLEVLKV